MNNIVKVKIGLWLLFEEFTVTIIKCENGKSKRLEFTKDEFELIKKFIK